MVNHPFPEGYILGVEVRFDCPRLAAKGVPAEVSSMTLSWEELYEHYEGHCSSCYEYAGLAATVECPICDEKHEVLFRR